MVYSKGSKVGQTVDVQLCNSILNEFRNKNVINPQASTTNSSRMKHYYVLEYKS